MLAAVKMGDDINVSIYGGDRSHIGAVAVAQARPSLEDPARQSASTSVITITGHKEDMLARSAAAKIAAATGGIVSVSCGIHMDNADKEQIAAAVEIVEVLIQRLLVEQEEGWRASRSS